MPDFRDVLQQAVTRQSGEAAQRSCISAILANLGHTATPRSIPATLSGKPARLYAWQGSPAGDIVLLAGKVYFLDEVTVDARGNASIHPRAPNTITKQEAYRVLLPRESCSKGGKTTAARMTPEQRTARARKALMHRFWKNAKRQHDLAREERAKRKKKKRAA